MSEERSAKWISFSIYSFIPGGMGMEYEIFQDQYAVNPVCPHVLKSST